jgi:hypothetical protein
VVVEESALRKGFADTLDLNLTSSETRLACQLYNDEGHCVRSGSAAHKARYLQAMLVARRFVLWS